MSLRNWFKKNLKDLFLVQNIYRRLILNKNSFLYESGWVDSILQNKPVNSTGSYIPWFNYSFFVFLEYRMPKGGVVFEYGLGYSTIYLGNKVDKVFSVEHDVDWVDNISLILNDKANIIFNEDIDGKGYAHSISIPKSKFDLVFVDGRDRVYCCKYAVNYLSDKGVVILDDSQRSRYQEIFGFMNLRGFRELTFTSFKPCMNKLASTTIFYRANNCLGI